MTTYGLAETPSRANPFTAEDVVAILRERGWLRNTAIPAVTSAAAGGEAALTKTAEAWFAQAAALLGPQAAEVSPTISKARAALAEMLELIFSYDARAILASTESQAVMAREGARAVIRELAHLVLDGPEIDSDRYKQIISVLKAKLAFRGRELFHPIRLALAGRAGEGELDRVILLLDSAARLELAVPVKGTRERMLEFCAALK